MTPRNEQDNDPPVRMDLVRRVRQAIADGVYETPERWQGALERLMDQVL
jgi:anti-sigma28 factor (negative regulator of flagellin synthesis)